MRSELTEVITTAGNEMINIKNERFIKLVSDLANSFFTLSISNLVFFSWKHVCGFTKFYVTAFLVGLSKEYILGS